MMKFYPEIIVFFFVVLEDEMVSSTTSVSSISRDLDKQIEELESELDKKLTKKQKYKALYKEERGKYEAAKAEHGDELQKKDAEIARLKRRISEIPNEYDLKMRALEV